MIPLLHLFTAIGTIICLFGIQRIYSSYLKTKSEDLANFLKAFIFLGIYFALSSLPAFFKDPVKVQIIYIIYYTPVILSANFFLKVAFRIFGWLRWSKYTSFLIYSLIIITAALNIIFFSPAKIITADDIFYHWGEGTPAWLGAFYGIFIGILAAGCALLFLLKGGKSQDPFIRTRSLRLGTGIMLFVVAALLNYVAPGSFLGIIQWVVSALASIIALIALILILSGVYYKISRELFPAEKEQISKG